MKRLKNPVFWFGIIAVILSSTRINPETLTSWTALQQALLSVFSNPYLIGCLVVALVSVWNNPTTPGLKD